MIDDPFIREEGVAAMSPVLHFDATLRVNFASTQNDIPVIRRLRVENPIDRSLVKLTLRLSGNPSTIRPKAKIKVRRALLYHALKRLRLDTDPGARKPQYQLIGFLNREAIHEDHG